MKIFIEYYEDDDAQPYETPEWIESVHSVVQAEEALGRLERFLEKNPPKKHDDEIPF